MEKRPEIIQTIKAMLTDPVYFKTPESTIKKHYVDRNSQLIQFANYLPVGLTKMPEPVLLTR